MLTQSINLGIVDDHSLFRKVLRNYLSQQTNINVVVQASDMGDLFSKLKGSSVDILLADLFMPEPDISSSIRLLIDLYPGMKILVLSMCTDLDLISDLLDLGIHGYVSKSDEPEELLQAIITVHGNRLYRNWLFTEALYRNKQKNNKKDTGTAKIDLNHRERKILELLWEEKSNKEIADQIFLSVRSVEKIRQDMKEKLGVKSTVGLLKYAISEKIITETSRTTNLIR
ncbi:response regulator [Flavitalea flava]